jgi:hypothetical protein
MNLLQLRSTDHRLPQGAFGVTAGDLVNGSSFSDANSMYIAYNGWSDSVTFTLPAPPTGTNWYRVTDTCNWNDGPNTFVTPGNESSIGGEGTICGQSLLLQLSKWWGKNKQRQQP